MRGPTPQDVKTKTGCESLARQLPFRALDLCHLARYTSQPWSCVMVQDAFTSNGERPQVRKSAPSVD